VSRRRDRGFPAPRVLRRDADGALFDLDEQRVISLAELRDDVRGGRRFRAQRHGDGGDCTYAVLAEIVTGRAHDARTREARGSLANLLRGVRDAAGQAEDDRRDDVRRRPGREDQADRRRGRGRDHDPPRAEPS